MSHSGEIYCKVFTTVAGCRYPFSEFDNNWLKGTRSMSKHVIVRNKYVTKLHISLLFPTRSILQYYECVYDLLIPECQ